VDVYLCIKKLMPLDYDLASLILPLEILPYFEVIRVIKHEQRIDLYLDERNNPPKQPYTYLSKGFTDERIIQDFPLRGRAVFLHVRKRKWQERETGHIVTNSYELAHQGTHLTYEFASFLKATY
jgi:transposase